MEPLHQFLIDQVIPKLRFPVSSLLLVGSHAEGNANFTSDIDVIAVLDGPAAAAGGGARFRVREHGLEVDGQSVGVTYTTEEHLRRRLKRLDRLYRRGGHVTDGFASRISDAVPVHDPGGVGRALVEEARAFRPAPGTYREMMKSCLSFYHDALGVVHGGDPGTAVLMARQAAAGAIDCFLLDRGMKSLKPKWHLRRLEKLGATSLLERYRRILGVDKIDQKEALQIFAEMDRLVCEVMGIETLHQFDRSPLLAPRKRGRAG